MADAGKLVLVVDDDPDARDYLTTVLEDNGYETVSARDGVEALAALEERLPDLVTLDITMPEKSGVGVYRRLREEEAWKDIKVIIITGVSDDFEQFISSRRQVPPPDGFIHKPVDSPLFMKQVTDLIG